MKKHSLLASILIIFITLTSCVSNIRMQPYAGDEALKETWMNQVNTLPNNWLKNIDPWFLTGEPNLIQKQTDQAPFYKAVTTSAIRVPDFKDINVVGDFQVQIVGSQDANSVYVFGTNDLTNQVTVEMVAGQLNIRQTGTMGNMQKVLVRIGVRELRSLTNLGNSLILGRTIHSKKLLIHSSGAGSIYLEGNINLRQVKQFGSGTITVIGAETPRLKIDVRGSGNVNISGRVGIENIIHDGDGCINIIGADSDGLCIVAKGNGVTNLFGYVNVGEITACNNSRVYLYWAFSRDLNIDIKDNAIIGLAGTAANMNVSLTKNSRFQGEYMRSCTLYIQTKDHAHADVGADLKIFATASNWSSIYYYGSPKILIPYKNEHATVIPLGNYLTPVCGSTPCTFTPPPFCGPLPQS